MARVWDQHDLKLSLGSIVRGLLLHDGRLAGTIGPLWATKKPVVLADDGEDGHGNLFRDGKALCGGKELLRLRKLARRGRLLDLFIKGHDRGIIHSSIE